MTIEQKVSVVANTETDINTEISTQNTAGYAAFSITLSGTDVIILFQRVNTDVA